MNAIGKSTMKAIVQTEYGSPEVLALKEIDRPEIGADDLLVRVQAGGVDRGVWHLMTGRPYLLRIMGFGLRAPKARVRGAEVAGQVVALGKNVTDFKIGDEVFGTCEGSFAEYACAPAQRFVRKPVSLSFVQAAAVPISAATALQALRNVGGLKSGQKVLIIGAAGGVGTFAVQLAKALGAEVTGVCSTAKVDLVRSLGADAVIDYTRADCVDGAHRYDLILDTGGNRAVAHLRRALTPHGTLVIVGGEGGGRWFGGIGRQFGAMLLSPFIGQKLRTLFAIPHRDDLQYLAQLIEAGKLAPVIDRTYPLPDTPEAIRHLERGHISGKLVITV